MKVFLVLLLGLVLSCSRKSSEGEHDLLNRAKFTEVLLEAQLIEARVNHELVVQHIMDVPTSDYYDDLFLEKGTDREQFTRTYAYYAARPEELKAIYEEIITELTLRKDGPAQ